MGVSILVYQKNTSGKFISSFEVKISHPASVYSFGGYEAGSARKHINQP